MTRLFINHINKTFRVGARFDTELNEVYNIIS
jgi:hypothetical protein